MNESKRKFAGGYNGDRYSVTGYSVCDTNYIIESKNSIIVKVFYNQDRTDEAGNINIMCYDVYVFRHDQLIFDYSYNFNKKILGNSNTYSLIDNLAVNVLFQLDERELDKIIPMIQNSTEHSFTLERFNNDPCTYYIHCKSDNTALDEFIIKKFNDKFYFNECSLYHRNMVLNKALSNYSYFDSIDLYYSLSDDDAYFHASGYHAGFFFLFDSNEHNIKYLFTKKKTDGTDEIDEFYIFDVNTIDEFCDKTFKITTDHILSDDYIVNAMNKVVTDFDIDVNQDWKSFLHLFDMATI